MAKIGTWGGIAFEVSSNKIKTFEGMKLDIAGKWATHDRHLKAPLLEFTGTDLESISFSVKLSVYLGASPSQEIESIKNAVKTGEVHRLILGLEDYGKWIMEKASFDLEIWDNYGNLLSAEASISMKQYAER